MAKRGMPDDGADFGLPPGELDDDTSRLLPPVPAAQPAALPALAPVAVVDYKAPKKRRKSDILLLVLAIVLMLAGAAVGYSTWYKAQVARQGASQDMGGNYVVPDDPSIDDPGFLKAADPKDDTGVRFIIRSVKLDVPLGEINEVDGVINPSGFTSAYRVRNLGVGLDKAETGTVYVAAHSVHSPGVGPGNYVLDVAHGSIAVHVGDQIEVGDRTYVLTSSRVVLKTDLGTQPDIWSNQPGMLVFITCMQPPPITQNAILIGQLIK